MTCTSNQKCYAGHLFETGRTDALSFRKITMRKVTVQLEMRIVMLVDEGVAISDVVSELDYEVKDTTTAADILDTEITGYEVVDSK